MKTVRERTEILASNLPFSGIETTPLGGTTQTIVTFYCDPTNNKTENYGD